MRCRSCDCVLTNFEATRKIKGTQEYLDLCNQCYKPISKGTFQVQERWDLWTSKDRRTFDDERGE